MRFVVRYAPFINVFDFQEIVRAGLINGLGQSPHAQEKVSEYEKDFKKE